MANEKPKIKIDDPISAINAKFDLYIKFVVGVLIVAIITMIFMVSTLITDSFHFNSTVYKEYSEKTAAVENTQKINEELLKEIQENQKLILEQQKQINQLFKK